MAVSRPDQERERGSVTGRTLPPFVFFIIFPAAAAAAAWVAARFAPGTLASGVVSATAVLVAVVCLFFFRSRGAGGTDLSALRRAGEVIYHAEEGIVTISARGLVLDLNPAAEKMFGYHTAEVVNRPISLLLSEPPAQERTSLLRDTLPAGSILGLAAGAREVIGVRKNGETFPLELTGNSMLVGDEAVSVAFVRDVSKRKRAQRYLLAHYTATCVLAETGSLGEALPRILQTLGEALQWDSVAYWEVDAANATASRGQEYHLLSAGAAFQPEAAPATCRRGEGLVGRVWATCQPTWSDCGPTGKDLPHAGTGSGALRSSFGFPVLVGNDVYGVLTVASRRPHRRDEQLLGVMAELGKQLGQFLTRKRQEEALRETSQTLQSLVHAAPVAIHLVDPEGKVRLWNPSAERIFGWPAAEVIGHPLPPIVPSAEGDSIATPAPVGAREAGLPTRCRRKDGEAIEMSLSTAPLRDAAGNVVGALGIGMDLTEQRNLEHQLRQAQKMEAVGQLAGGVAHDFNNLLTIINGYTSVLLAEDELRAEQSMYLGEIQKAGERAAGLTRQLLAFSRKEIARPRPLDINQTVANVKSMLQRLIGENIQLTTALDRSLGLVCADPGQIEQVLVNLAVNARDAMPGGGRLSLTTRSVSVGTIPGEVVPELLPGRYARLTVRDTGCGMDARTLARAFEPFFTTKEVGKGTGLGLATVYGIVQQAGGHARVRSKVGEGSTFEVYLPALQDTATEPSGPADAPPARQVLEGRETILLAEDETGLRALARRVLQARGYKVLEASNGEEAIRVAERNVGAIDLLLTDVVMPDVGGRAAAESVTTRFPSVKVLYMSGYTDDEILRNGVLRSDRGFLSKPFSPDELLHKVREVLDNHPECGNALSSVDPLAASLDAVRCVR